MSRKELAYRAAVLILVALSAYWAYDAREVANRAEDMAREAENTLGVRIHELEKKLDN